MSDTTPYDRYNVPGDGESKDDWPSIVLEIWEQQEIEIQGAVETQNDLPAPDEDAETADGQRRRYYVRDADAIYREEGDGWEVSQTGPLDQHAADDDAHHDEDHAERHHESGADELDAADLSGTGGEDGEYLTTDGESASWTGISVEQSIDAIDSSSGGNVSQYHLNGTSSDQTYVDIDGPGVLVGGSVRERGADTSNYEEQKVHEVTVDGVTFDIIGHYFWTGDNALTIATLPVIRFEDSLELHTIVDYEQHAHVTVKFE